MRVVLTGATGMIGRALTRALSDGGDQVVALVRNESRGRELLGAGVDVRPWPDPAAPVPEAAIAGADAVVNLVGEPLAQRWSEQTKTRIRDSRVLGTRSLVEALRMLPDEQRPRTLVSQSAVGYYGARDQQPVDEGAPAGSDFLAGVVAAWEQEALAGSSSMRVAVTRTGVVLSTDGGALAKMLPFVRLGVGGPVGGGRQYLAWVHLTDAVEAIRFCLQHEPAQGPLNVTAPNAVTNAEFSRALGRALHRPAVLPVPAAALRLLYGEMAQTVLAGQNVIPARLSELGYVFRYPEIDPALHDLLG